jgi:hypothetical protein
MNHVLEFVKERIQQHEDNLVGWREPDGFLLPTEPDPEERDRVRLQLKDAIHELQLVQREIERGHTIGERRQGKSPLKGRPLNDEGAIKFSAEPLDDNTAKKLHCANCGELSTNPGQFLRDGRWVCTDACRKELCDKDSYDDLAASGGIVDAP